MEKREDEVTAQPGPGDSSPPERVKRPRLEFPGMTEVHPAQGNGATKGPRSSQPQLVGAEIPAPEVSDQDESTQGLSGREQTLSDQAAITGREQTLTGPASPAALSGREQTLASPAAISGREQTLAGPATPTPVTLGDATRGTALADATPRTVAGKPRTHGGRTSAGFDAGWHLQGRKGPHTGQIWGDFELGGILGEGGMGAVYRGVQTSLRRRVAVKVLPPNLASDPRLLQRFQLEAETASRMQSPHVVQVYFIGEHDGNHFFCMEFVDGTDLYDVIRERRDKGESLSLEACTEYILQAARGLAEAGRLGVVHRDIKPPNMMVTKDGLLKIADFGIVKVLGESQLTMTGQAVGTPAYVSPEQGRGDNDIDARSDLYSLGVVFYELVCGKKPFEATTPNALIYKHCYEEPELPQKINPTVSSEVQAIILRLMQKKAENRYQSASELVHDLEMLKTGALVKSALDNYARGTGADEAKREQMSWLQRNVLPLALAAALVVAGGGYLGYRWLQQKSQEKLAQAEASTKAAKAADVLRPKLSALDRAEPLPAGASEAIEELARIAPLGDQDPDVQRWRAKLKQVNELEQALAVLDGERISPAFRAQAVPLLATYVELVGAQAPAALRWQGRLEQLHGDEARLRESLRGYFAAGALDQARRDAVDQAVGELATLVPEDDPLVQQGRERVVAFDQGLQGLLAQLSVLDQGLAITATKRAQLLTALGQFAPLVGQGDERVVRYQQRLDQAGDEVARYRRRLEEVFRADRLSLPALDGAEADLTYFASLVGDGDSDLKRYVAKTKATRERYQHVRDRLVQLAQQAGEDPLLATSVRAGAEPATAELALLAHPGDEVVADWQSRLQASAQQAQRLRERLLRLEADQPQPLSLAQQSALSADVGRAVHKGVIDAEAQGRYRTRLAAEAERVASNRRFLGAELDGAHPFSQALAEQLEQFLRDVAQDDADGLRWRAKRDRIRNLRERLGVLDERRSVPEGVEGLFLQLTQELGPEAPEIQRWQHKVTQIAQAQAVLSVLDSVAPIPETAPAQLASLQALVGEDDPQVRRYAEKIHRVQILHEQMQAWQQQQGLSLSAEEQARKILAETLTLTGSGDQVSQVGAQRLVELIGPPTPSWALDSGRDSFGLWAEAEVAGQRFRVRYVAQGAGILGASDGEPGAEADEVAVAYRLTQGFWLGEQEVTQALWLALTSENPSRFVDLSRPVERVSIPMVERWLSSLAQAIAGLQPRLPSEAEWEYAARAGSREAWALPEGAESVDDIAWYAENSGAQTQPVGGRYPNALGFMDMHGNVAEWCADRYAPYPTSETRDPLGRVGDRRVARGGSWGDPAASTRAANRIAVSPQVASAYLGFRICAPVDWATSPALGAVLIGALAPVNRKSWTVRIGAVELTISIPQATVPQPQPPAPAPVDPSPTAALRAEEHP